MSLYTGKKINAYEWTTLPIDDDIVSRVEELAEQHDQPDIIDKTPLCEWHDGRIIEDEEYINILEDENTIEPDIANGHGIELVHTDNAQISTEVIVEHQGEDYMNNDEVTSVLRRLFLTAPLLCACQLQSLPPGTRA